MDTDKQDEFPIRWRAGMTLENQHWMREAIAAQAASKICVHLCPSVVSLLYYNFNFRVQGNRT